MADHETLKAWWDSYQARRRKAYEDAKKSLQEVAENIADLREAMKTHDEAQPGKGYVAPHAPTYRVISEALRQGDVGEWICELRGTAENLVEHLEEFTELRYHERMAALLREERRGR